MLSDKNIESAFRIASKAFGIKRTITPLPDTPVALATRASLSEFQIINDANLDGRCGTPEGISEMLREACNTPNAVGQYVHDDAIAELVKQIAPVVQKSFFIAKNAVVPATNGAFNAFQVQANEIDKQSLTDCSVNVFTLSPLWSNPSFEQMVSRFSGAIANDIALKNLNIAISYNNAFDYIKTGISTFDEANQKSIDNKYLTGILIAAFSGGSALKLKEVLSSEYGKMDSAAIVFLAAKNLLVNIPEGLNVSLEEYRDYMTSIMAEAGRVVCFTFKRIENDRRVKRFVIDATSKTATVESVMWYRFCEEGGDTETLFGSLVTDRNFDYDSMIKNKESLKRAYEVYLKSRRHQFEELKYDGLRNALYAAISTACEELWDVENKPSISGNLARLCKSLQITDFQQIYNTIRKLICEVTYPGTDVCTILNLYDECASKVVSKEPREIAALTLMYYVTDWLSHQVEVRSFSYPAEL